MALKKAGSKKVTPLFGVKDIAKLGIEYAEVSAQMKELDSKKKSLSEKIKDGVMKHGVKDDNGSYYLETDTQVLGRVAKKSFNIDHEKAVQKLESMGLGDVVDVVTVRTVNEDKLQKAVAEKRITLEQVKDFTNEKVSYSVSVKNKEVMPEVEVSTAKVARKKK